MFTMVEILILMASVIGVYVACHYSKSSIVRAILIILLIAFFVYMFATREPNYILIANSNVLGLH